MKRFLIAVVIVVAGCATPLINQFAALETSYTAAEVTATHYLQLPQCGAAGATVVCSDPKIKAQILSADNIAVTELTKARNLMNSTGVADMTAAQAAVAAFQNIVAGLPIK